MANKYGFASVNNQLNKQSSSKTDNTKIQEQLEGLKQVILSARVTDIILSPDHPKFNEYGGFTGIGTIFFEPVENATLNINSFTTALPLFTNLKCFPLVNELVLLFFLPNNKTDLQSDKKQYFYISSIGIWNNQHINAYPNLLKSTSTVASENKSYLEIEQGQTRKSGNEEIVYGFNSSIGGSFIERSNIHPLLYYAGDTILEGRWGNSIRIGSTVNGVGVPYPNSWSGMGTNGDPITIIRNGQSPDSTEEGWVPVTEDINKDLSSIYLTSTQAIPLDAKIPNNPAIQTNPPESIKSYIGSQVILSSNRLILNTKEDSILVSSGGSLSLGSIGAIGIYSKESDVVLQSNRGYIRMGDPRANQSAILGDKFIDDFKILLQKLETLCSTLSTEPQLYLTSTSANSAKFQISEMLNDLNQYKSKIVKLL